ncbi:hypothetical protein [Microbacterium sp. SLBN-111]|uniref:helix-turn-helix domain-containing protein n=1 Tax=Microbacterium sp. SLBN-111 TaxID=3377733 RepID=UPI003C736F7B
MDWLSAQGWRATGLIESLRIFADLIRADPFALGRIWHTSCRAKLVGNESWGARNFLMVIGIDGTQILHTTTGTHVIRPGDVYLQNLNEPMVVEASQPVGRMVIVSEWDRLRTHRGPPIPIGQAWAADPDYLRVILSTMTATLNTPVHPRTPGFGSVQRSLEALIEALVLQREPARLSSLSTSQADLVARALQVIETCSADPAFTVDTLADILGVSRSYLHLSFAPTGVTPSRRLRYSRVFRAQTLLAERNATGERELERIARMAGFRTVRTMQRALLEGGMR